MRSRVLALVAFLSVWLLAAILPELGLATGNLSLTGAVPPFHGAMIGGILTILLSAALAVTPVFLTGLVIHLVLQRRRHRDEMAPEPMSAELRFRFREAILPVLLLMVVVAAGYTIWTQLSAAEGQSSRAVPLEQRQTSLRDRRPATVSNSGSRKTRVPSWVVFAAAGMLLTGTAVWLWRTARQQEDAGQGDVGPAETPMAAAPKVTEAEAVSEPVFACYRDMCILLSDRLPIKDSMTPREFVRQLRQVGFSSRDVDALTGLFERVRYGHQTAGPGDREQARSALETIRGQKRGGERA